VGANGNRRNEAYSHRVRRDREPTGCNRGYLVECAGGSDDYRKISRASYSEAAGRSVSGRLAGVSELQDRKVGGLRLRAV
jgi:hypothetical protein